MMRGPHIMVGTVRFTAIIATVHSLWCYGVSLLFFFAVFNVVPRISLDDPRNCSYLQLLCVCPWTAMSPPQGHEKLCSSVPVSLLPCPHPERSARVVVKIIASLLIVLLTFWSIK